MTCVAMVRASPLSQKIIVASEYYIDSCQERRGACISPLRGDSSHLGEQRAEGMPHVGCGRSTTHMATREGFEK
jgi:hypothetical protein